jgi:hypothetical protein
MEKGNEFWYMECKKSVYVRVTTVARELTRYELDLAGVQEVRRDKGGTVRAGNYIFFLQ